MYVSYENLSNQKYTSDSAIPSVCYLPSPKVKSYIFAYIHGDLDKSKQASNPGILSEYQ